SNKELRIQASVLVDHPQDHPAGMTAVELLVRTNQELESLMPTAPKYVYAFGGGKADGRSDMKDLLGGKGANLAEMSSIGIPVPPGFTITTEVCQDYYAADRKLPDAVKPQVEVALKQVEDGVGKKFGDSSDPLLVSVRS